MLTTTESLVAQSLRKRKYWLLFSCLAVFGISFALQSLFSSKYTSSVRFIVNESDVIDLNVPSIFKTESDHISTSGMSRMHVFIHSSECMNHMIEKFDLYTHYRIDPDKPFAYERLVSRFSRNTGLMVLKQQKVVNVMVLSVQDRDREMAMLMANELLEKLHALNDDYIRSRLKRKLVIYTLLYEDIKKELQYQKENMRTVIDGYRDLVSKLEAKGIEADGIYSSLTTLTNSFQEKENEMVNIRQLYVLASNAIENKSLGSITLLNKALPDLRSPVNRSLAISAGIMVGYLCLVLVFVFIYYENREFIRTLFLGKAKRKTAKKELEVVEQN